MATKHNTVFRVANIPLDTSIQKLKDVLCNEMLPEERQSISIQVTIVPSPTEEDTNTALVTFTPTHPNFLESLFAAVGREDLQLDTALGDLSFDKTFYGLTQLYPTVPGTPIQADIIAVTGLDGHAYGSWRGKGSLGRMWLRDFLAKDFPSCRTMLYGYNTKLREAGIHTLYDYKLDLLNQIKEARSTPEQRKRPLIFIAHSFGGIVLTQALVKAEEALGWDDDPETHTIYRATKGILFFGTPHRGLPTDDILRMIDVRAHPERAELVRSIRQEAPQLLQELQKFGHFAENFRIYSFYERQKTKGINMINGTPARTGDYIVPVNLDSALLNLPGVEESPIPVDGDHSTIVKFNSQTDRTYRTVTASIKQVLKGL